MDTAFQRAQELSAAGKNEAALLAYEEAWRQDENDFRAAMGAGLLRQRLQLHDEAIAAFTKVAEMQPQLPQAPYSRALSLRALGRYEEALDDLHIALDLDPGYIDAIYASGINLKSLERYSEALDAFNIVLGKAGKYPPASHGRATLRSILGDYAGAIVDFTAGIEGGIDDAGVRLLRGLAHYRIGNLPEAETDLTRSIEMRPHDGGTYMRRWQVYKDMGKEELAARDMETGKKLLAETNPKEPPAQSGL